MSEQNMSTILDSIEEVYRKHRRHDVTSTLTNLIIDGISSHSVLLDSYVVLHAAFVSSLHKMIGVEFAAYFVQNVVSSYERHLTSITEQVMAESTDPPEGHGKECSNLIVLLSELYNFQTISCVLVYDIIRDLLNNVMTEFRVELLLKILRNSGQQLRQDDPTALKDIVTIAQTKLAGRDGVLSSRTAFMLETLNNLKNNKIKKSAAQHQGGDTTERMKKFLSGLGKKRHVLAHEPLRVSLEDLRSAESKGKWWLVGAAWGGDPLLDQHQDAQKTGEAQVVEDGGTDALVKLSRKQGMNTDIRRSIFVVLMSSDDYLDACERLAQLSLTETQQREIIRVALHCCGNEKTYNPYYTLVCQHLCQRSHSYKITLQFCLWDFLRDLGETTVGGAEVIKNLEDDDGSRFNVKTINPSRMKNVAKAYAWWIAKDCCSLTILKPVDFTFLKPQTQKFIKELFIQVFVASQVSSPILGNGPNDYPASRNRGDLEEVFKKASRIENLGVGLLYFMSENFRAEEGLVKWGCAVARETLQAGMDHVPRL
ncbi:ARM repeat-containing protein [Leucogyrophana mollusca]|uniref:ARM repeat-containing protein n=1 Tax=Leucogyrophana mollusca TaxID=85980 RepID=A0ACB8BXD3_9AGAM|nr:ARM repeat-containing protein [Leucogyrophana mollusca]